MSNAIARKALTTIALTTGNRDGIGLEVTLKALQSLQKRKAAGTVRLNVICDDSPLARRMVRKYFPPARTVRRTGLAVNFEYRSGNEAEWFEDAVRAALNGTVDAIVTGPLSKDRFQSLKRPPTTGTGHNGLLEVCVGVRPVQAYVGKTKAETLAILLATDHLPVKDIEAALTMDVLARTLAAAEQLIRMLPAGQRRRPLAILGLNPHAGEGGILGDFEARTLAPWVARQNALRSAALEGPLSADGAFAPQARKRYSAILALYHDQGLIPFKTLFGQETGFQISLGLPFVRTSVDHGTASDIFGKNRANSGSMLAAIEAAITATKVRIR